jgi:hypothetical protein
LALINQTGECASSALGQGQRGRKVKSDGRFWIFVVSSFVGVVGLNLFGGGLQKNMGY